MWPFTSEIRIRTGQLWRGFALLLALFATKLDAASSSSVLSSSFASSVLPSVSSSTLSTRIQSITSSRNGGISTAPSSKYGNNATSANDATPSLPSSSSITKTETSALSISETRTFNSQRTTVLSKNSQDVGASQTSRNVGLSTVSLKYSINTSAVFSSSLNLKSSSVQPLQTSEMSPSLQLGNTSASMPYLTSVVSSAVNLSNVVSATRTLLLTQSTSIGKLISSQSLLSHTLTVNGSSTELPSSSIAGSLSSQKANSLMASSSSVTMATNRTLATSPLTSSMLTNASKIATETFSTRGMSLTSLASSTSKSFAASKMFGASDSVVTKSVTMHGTLVLMNSSAQSVNATVMSATFPTIRTTILVTLSASQSSSSVVNFTHQLSPFASSTGLVSQTRAVADSSAVLPSDTPSLNETVSAVKTSGLLQSATTPSQTSVGVGAESSITTAVGESVMASQSATSQSNSATVSSAGVLPSITTASGEESTSVTSAVAVSSSQLVLPVTSSSSVTEGIISPTSTAMGKSPSSAPSVASSRLVISQTSQSSLTGRFTLTSEAVTSSRSSVETVTSAGASVAPNKTSIDEGFIVTSYSTPCYIYYVVEKTAFPVTTANHSAALSTSTTPKITLDIASASRMQSGLPSVTLTHTIAMTSEASERQSQVVGSSIPLTSSTSMVGVSADSSMITPSSTLRRMSSKVSVLSSEAVTMAMITATSKVDSTFQTGIPSTRVQSTPSLSGTLVIPRVTSSVLELQSTSLTSKASISSTMTLSGSFTPIVATASVSGMQNVTSPLITATSLSIIQATTKHQSLQSSPRSSGESMAFVPTVAKSLPSQNVSSTGTVSSVSLVISSDSKPVTTQSPDGSLFPTKSASITQASASSVTPTITFSGSSSESLVASSPSQFTKVLESSDVLMMNGTRMSQVPSATVSESLLSFASNQTSTKSISSPSALRSSLATATQDTTFITVTVSTQLGFGVTETGKASSSVEGVVQSSTMALEDSSASGVEMLSSSNIHTVMVTPSTVVSKGGAMSAQVGSSHKEVSSRSPSIASNKTSSVVAIVSTPISNSTQVAAFGSFSQTENKMSASSAQSFLSSGIHMQSSVSTSVQEPRSSVVLPLPAAPSQTGVIGVPGSSSIHVALSSSFSRADSKSSQEEHLPSSSSSFLLEASSSVSPGKRRRKKRAVDDTTNTTLVHSSSRAVLTSLSTATVASTSEGSSVVASIVPSSAVVTGTLQVSNKSPSQSAERRSTHGLVPTSVLSSSEPLESALGSVSSRSVSASFSSSTKTTSSSMPQRNSTSTVVLPSGSLSASSASVPVLTVNTTGVSSAVVKVTGSATSSFHSLPSQQATVTRIHTGSDTQSPSHSVLASSSGKQSSSLQAPEAVKSTTAHANLSVTNVVDTLTPSPTTVVLSAKVTSPSSLSLGTVTSSALLGNRTSTSAQSVVSESSRVTSSSVGVVISSTFVDNRTLPSTSPSHLEPSASAVLGNSTSTLPLSVTNVPSSVKSRSSDVDVSSTFVHNRTLPSTSSQYVMLSSAILSDSASSLAQSTTSMNQASTLIGNTSVTASTSIVSPDMSSSFVVVIPSTSSVSSSFIQPPGESSITVLSSSPRKTNIRSVTSSSTVSSPPLISVSVASTTLHGSREITSSLSPSSSPPLSSPTTDQSSQAVSSSVLTRSSPSAVQSSEVQQTVVSSSVQISSSSRVYRPPLVTISSLGICYVVYTTRIVQPSLVSTPPVNMSSTASVIVSSTVSDSVSSPASVNVSSTRVLSVVTQSLSTTVIQASPSASLNTSSVVVQPTLDVNTTRAQFSQVLSTALQVNVTVKPSGSSSSVIISSTRPEASSTTSPPVMASSTFIVRSSQSLSVLKSVSSIAVSTMPSVKETSLSTSSHQTSLSTSAHLPSTQVPTSQVISATPTVSKEVSSSVTVSPTQPPDPSLLIEAIFKVPTDTDIQSEEFKTDLEIRLASAYRFAELSRRRRKRATPEFNATINSIQRVNNEEDVNVTFFVTQDGQSVPASEAVQNYQKLSKAQLGSFIDLEVVSLPEALVVPTTQPPPENVLVSLLIQDSVSNNVSNEANKKKLEDNLAAYYKEQKQLTTTVTASIKTILHEPNEIVYLEFYVSVGDQAVNASDVVETFKVPNVNLLTAKLGFQVLVQVYIPDSLTASEADYVIIGISVPENQDLTNATFRSDLSGKLVKLYQKAKGQTNSRRKKRSGSTSVTIKDIVKKAESSPPEADVTFFVYDAGKVANASYVVSIMNRLSTGDMTTVTSPYAVLSAPRQAFVPIATTELTPTVAATPIKWWIIPAVIGPIILIIVIILLIWWRWKKGAPKSKVEPDTIRMLETNKRKPVQGFDVARYTEEGVSGMKTTAFMSTFHPPAVDDGEEAAAIPVKRETSLRRKVQKRPIQKPPVKDQRQENPAYHEEEEEEGDEDESVVSVTPPRSTEALTRERITAKPPPASRTAPAKPQRPPEPSELDSEEDSELTEGASESEPESVRQPEQTRHSAAQVPTVAVMSEASGPPRYPPVRFRSSVHPAPSLPPLDAKHTSLVGVKVEPPSEDDSTRGRRKGKSTKKELEQRADLERQKNKQRLRDRKRNASHSPGHTVPAERKAWNRAQYDFDDVLDEDDAERVITGRKRKPRRRRPPSSSVATDEERVPHLKSYRKLKSPKTTSSTSTRNRDKKRDKSESVSNASSDESEIDMNETRRRMHTMLDDAFSLFGSQFSRKLGKEPEAQPASHPEAHPEAHPNAHPVAHSEGYPSTPARQAIIPRYIGGQPALPEPPPAHGRATEPTPGQRRRVQPTMPGYPVGIPQTPIGIPGYPGRPPARPIVTRDPIVVWDPADRQRILNQRAPPPTYSYKDPSGQNVYITPVQQQRDDMGGLVWSPYAAEDSMDTLYPDLAQASYPGALSTSPPKDTSYLSHLQAAPPHDTVLNMSASGTLDQRGASLGQSPQPLIKSIKDELFRLSQGTSRKTPITEL